MTLICRIFLVLLVVAGPARAEPGGMRVDPSCLLTVWSPDEAELVGSDRWHDDRRRLSLDASAPGGEPALNMFSVQNQPSGLVSYKTRLREALRLQPAFARIQAEFYIPADTRFNVGAAKMPLGLWGGDPASEHICTTGGCPPERQTGFSARLTRIPVDEVSRPWDHGPRIYSYHLNRDGHRVKFEESRSKRKGPFDEMEYGEGFPMGVSFPLGEWFTMTMDLALNNIFDNVAQLDGFVDLYMHDFYDTLMGSVSAEGLIFREEPSWQVFGPLLADLWGGNQTSPKRTPIMDTRIYSRNYRLSLLEEGRSLGECLDPARLPAGWPAG